LFWRWAGCRLWSWSWGWRRRRCGFDGLGRCWFGLDRLSLDRFGLFWAWLHRLGWGFTGVFASWCCRQRAVRGLGRLTRQWTIAYVIAAAQNLSPAFLDAVIAVLAG